MSGGDPTKNRKKKTVSSQTRSPHPGAKQGLYPLPMRSVPVYPPDMHWGPQQ